MRTSEILGNELRNSYQVSNMLIIFLVEQDTDINQYKILKILAEKHRNLCCWDRSKYLCF